MRKKENLMLGEGVQLTLAKKFLTKKSVIQKSKNITRKLSWSQAKCHAKSILSLVK